MTSFSLRRRASAAAAALVCLAGLAGCAMHAGTLCDERVDDQPRCECEACRAERCGAAIFAVGCGDPDCTSCGNAAAGHKGYYRSCDCDYCRQHYAYGNVGSPVGDAGGYIGDDVSGSQSESHDAPASPDTNASENDAEKPVRLPVDPEPPAPADPDEADLPKLQGPMDGGTDAGIPRSNGYFDRFGLRFRNVLGRNEPTRQGREASVRRATIGANRPIAIPISNRGNSAVSAATLGAPEPVDETVDETIEEPVVRQSHGDDVNRSLEFTTENGFAELEAWPHGGGSSKEQIAADVEPREEYELVPAPQELDAPDQPVLIRPRLAVESGDTSVR